MSYEVKDGILYLGDGWYDLEYHRFTNCEDCGGILVSEGDGFFLCHSEECGNFLNEAIDGPIEPLAL